MMVLNREWLAKTQADLDGVIGPDRLPENDDLPQLPTVRAVVKEVARMRPVTAGGLSLMYFSSMRISSLADLCLPTGIAHKSTEDYVYNGYFIPKGSIVHPNFWYVLMGIL